MGSTNTMRLPLILEEPSCVEEKRLLSIKVLGNYTEKLTKYNWSKRSNSELVSKLIKRGLICCTGIILNPLFESIQRDSKTNNNSNTFNNGITQLLNMLYYSTLLHNISLLFGFMDRQSVAQQEQENNNKVSGWVINKLQLGVGEMMLSGGKKYKMKQLSLKS